MVLWFHAQYQKNNMSRFKEKCVTDRQTNGWINEGTYRQIDRHTQIHRTIPWGRVQNTDVCQAPKYTMKMPKVIYKNLKKKY